MIFTIAYRLFSIVFPFYLPFGRSSIYPLKHLNRAFQRYIALSVRNVEYTFPFTHRIHIVVTFRSKELNLDFYVSTMSTSLMYALHIGKESLF